jgi:hypothetical protein
LFQRSGLSIESNTPIEFLSSNRSCLTFFFFSYLLVGAAIFDALESNTEDLLRKQYQAAEANMLQSYNISRYEYLELEDIVIKYQPHKAGAQWKFPGAFYFSLTVITTIGKKSDLMHSSVYHRLINRIDERCAMKIYPFSFSDQFMFRSDSTSENNKHCSVLHVN